MAILRSGSICGKNVSCHQILAISQKVQTNFVLYVVAKVHFSVTRRQHRLSSRINYLSKTNSPIFNIS